MSTGKNLSILVLTLGAAACGGGAAQLPPSTPATTTVDKADVPSPKKVEPQADVAPAKAETTEAAAPKSEPAPETAAAPEPCDAKTWWACASVQLDNRKVEKRTTLLVGDSAFAETHSGTTDGRNPVVFTTEGGDVVSVALRRQPGNRSEIVVKVGKSADKLGPETIIDRHQGDDFQYVSVIGTVQNGKAFVDVRYMR